MMLIQLLHFDFREKFGGENVCLMHETLIIIIIIIIKELQ